MLLYETLRNMLLNVVFNHTDTPIPISDILKHLTKINNILETNNINKLINYVKGDNKNSIKSSYYTPSKSRYKTMSRVKPGTTSRLRPSRKTSSRNYISTLPSLYTSEDLDNIFS